MGKKYTKEELNKLEKNVLIDLLIANQEQLHRNMERLIEQIAIANNQRYGRKSEKLDVVDGQLDLYSLIVNEAEALTATSWVSESPIDDAIKPSKPRWKKGKRVANLKDFLWRLSNIPSLKKSFKDSINCLKTYKQFTLSKSNSLWRVNVNKTNDTVYLKDILIQLDTKINDCFIFPFSERINHLGNYLYVRNLMADEKSRKLYDKILLVIIATEFVGRKRAFELFPIFDSKEFLNIKGITPPDSIEGYGINSDSEIFHETFNLEGYSYDDICAVKPDDTVIDCGAYIGDTAIYFFQKMKGMGQIYCFEPSPETYVKLSKNTEMISSDMQVVPINMGLSKQEGKLRFTEYTDHMGSSYVDLKGTLEVDVTTIDIFCKNNRIKKVDFIKMDIEGAECDALHGAGRVIRTMSPKMAICIYHKFDDYWNVPQIILSYNPKYKFYLKHNSLWLTETVLFCVPTNEANLTQPINISSLSDQYILKHSLLASKNNVNIFNSLANVINSKLSVQLAWSTDTKHNMCMSTQLPDKHTVIVEFLGLKRHVQITVKIAGIAITHELSIKLDYCVCSDEQTINKLADIIITQLSQHKL